MIGIPTDTQIDTQTRTSSFTSPGLGRQLIASAVLGLSFLVTAIATPPPARAVVEEPMTLRVNDSVALPGGTLAVVLRTYVGRKIVQGTICLDGGLPRLPGTSSATVDASGRAAAGPIEALEGWIVFGAEGDVIASADFDEGNQITMIDFTSPGGSVNETDGPLLVLFYRLADTVAPGTEFDLGIDLSNTSMTDADGQPVELAPRAGTMEVRAAAEPVELGLDGDEVTAGGLLVFGAETSEGLAIGSGTVVIDYPTELAAEQPRVVLDPRHGQATATVTHPFPGRVVVDLASPDGSFNTVPGLIVRLEMLAPTDLVVGDLYPASIDASTQLATPAGIPIDLALDGGVIEVIPDEVLFASDFEDGDLIEWCAATP